ncbi:MAG TPA: ABC transporter permease, partial [Thermococcus sp.]|nr:ABC transporter permease [Thermococcus sp.]
MKLPLKSIARLVAIYLCVLLVIVLVAGVAANKNTWHYVYDAVESFRIFNPEFYSELERNATREGISVEEYYY